MDCLKKHLFSVLASRTWHFRPLKIKPLENTVQTGSFENAFFPLSSARVKNFRVDGDNFEYALRVDDLFLGIKNYTFSKISG